MSNNKPHIDRHGTLVIPFSSDPKYHWWNKGQSILETLKELGASEEVMEKYQTKISGGHPKPVEVIDSKKEGGHE